MGGMNTIISHRYLIRQNLIAFIGVCICMYFAYHAIYGNRSYVKHMSLSSQIESMSQNLVELQKDRVELERKVAMMRPGSVDADLLEERVRLVLGYKHKDEKMFMP